MKVRIGTGILGWPFPKKDAAYFWDFVDLCEGSGVDSIWISDRIVSPNAASPLRMGLSLESMTALSALAGRTKRMKFGNSVLAMPLRNPVVLAKEIATIDFLSGGRMLPAIGLGTDTPAEFEACGVDIKQRAGRTDEGLALMRRLWTEDNVTFQGRYYCTTGVTVEPRPAQKPCPPVWIGGRTEAAYRRVGRIGDGWLTSFLSPSEVGAGIASIRRHAAEASRAVPEDHYGAIIGFCLADTREEALRIAGPYLMSRARPEVSPESYNALGTIEDVASVLRDYVAAGATKFVMRAVCPPDQTMAQTERLARDIVPLFHR